MSGDLEDFLRRAAQRRQAKAAQERQQASAAEKRQPPQYSDRKRERVVDAVIVDDVPEAELVQDDTNSLAARQRKLAESKKAAAEAEAAAKKRASSVRQSRRSQAAVAHVLSGNPSEDLLNLIKSPGGIRQAILLREILDRPEHRW